MAISKLRKSVFDFAQKELAPYAEEIDETDEFINRRVVLKWLFYIKIIHFLISQSYKRVFGKNWVIWA